MDSTLLALSIGLALLALGLLPGPAPSHALSSPVPWRVLLLSFSVAAFVAAAVLASGVVV